MNNHPIIALGNKFFESYNKLPESEQKKQWNFLINSGRIRYLQQ